ncbi:hypothetical protein GCM10011391_17260 [Pullulanibacillus camelliae]|uniref:Cell wall elongation regulator TseB-like domain-containing protein n=1 Tax=Pullulanibacillus camelliae TaxID=1707096 RepID=A0A8J2VUV9_9BACL|nr:DUF5590 domain-containing protein [Pullulanibacillus camelliae]GGE39019.1 hypothetical protein GCM10011391_17260 [Pullulanibacillus camelliae]
MYKWLWVVVAVIIFLGCGLGFLYHAAMSPKRADADHAKQYAREHYNVKRIVSVSDFHGKTSYHVVKAYLNSKKKPVYIFIPDDKKKNNVTLVPVEDGYTKDEILKAFRTHVRYKQIISASLGMVSNTPAWEIVYKDDENHFVFSYYNFNNGDSLSDPIAIE